MSAASTRPVERPWASKPSYYNNKVGYSMALFA
jgi:hypothetical protein